MRRKAVRPGACGRVTDRCDQALTCGALALPPLLEAHAARCPRCRAEVAATRGLLTRLREAANAINTDPVLPVVNAVVQAAVPAALPNPGATGAPGAPIGAAGAPGPGAPNGPAGPPGAGPPAAPGAAAAAGSASRPGDRGHWRWVLGQVALVAVLLVTLTGALAWTAWQVAGAVGAAQPGQVVSTALAPLANWTRAGIQWLSGDVRR